MTKDTTTTWTSLGTIGFQEETELNEFDKKLFDLHIKVQEAKKRINASYDSHIQAET